MRGKIIYLIVFILIVVMTAGLTACGEQVKKAENGPGAEGLPADNPGSSEHISLVFPQLKQGKVLQIVNPSGCVSLTGKKALSEAEKIMLVNMQGIVAQTSAEIFIGPANDPWINYIKTEYKVQTAEIKDFAELINKYKDRLDDNGYVRYNSKLSGAGKSQTNQASTISGANRWLAVPVIKDGSDLEKALKDKCGLKLKFDLFNNNMTEAEVIMKYKDKLNMNFIAGQHPSKTVNLRDYAIAVKAPFYFYNTLSDKNEKDSVYKLLNPLGVFLGWQDFNNDGVGEGDFVQYAATYGATVLPSDWNNNFSVWASLPREKMKQKTPVKNASYDKADNNKYHYVTFLYSDGDNVTWWQGLPFDKERVASKNKDAMPFGWTMSPALLETMPMIMKYTYQNMSEYQNFVCAGSGYNYTNPSYILNYKGADVLRKFMAKTDRLMADADMKYISVLDAKRDKRVLDLYAEQPHIQGGFMMYGHYSNESGAIYWSNNKPFVSDREILWDRSKEASPDAGDSPAKTAIRLAYYQKDKTKIEGYTFIQVHAWSYTYEDLYKQFLPNVDKEKVKIVTPDEFMSLIKENVDKSRNVDRVQTPVWNDPQFSSTTGVYNQVRDAGWTLTDNTDAAVKYSGTWENSNTLTTYKQTETTSREKGASAEYSFNGTQARIYGTIHSYNGKMEVYIDGKLDRTVDTYNTFLKNFEVLYESKALQAGEHTVRLVLTGTKNDKSYAAKITVDAFGYK